jgi:fermentation-respiration switch protein FrsA (DUF1100 family)
MTFTADDFWLLLRTLGGIALVLLFLRWYEPRMIYYPNHPTRHIEQTPDNYNLAFDHVTLTTLDGIPLKGWFLPTSDDKSQTILFFHGNAGNISHCLPKCRVLRELGFAVFVLDYRGYGESEGCPSESGTYRDADATYAYLTEKRGIGPQNIVLYGESLGSGIAVDLATRAPVGGVILEAAYTSLADVGQRIFWFLPGIIRLLVRNRYDSLAKIPRISAPLLMLHSSDDEIFRYKRHALRLFAAAREPKQLVCLQGTHADAFFVSKALCREAIAGFIARPTVSSPAKHE